MAGNAVTAVTNGNGVQVTTFSADVSAPTLVSFNLDMSLLQLQVFMSEPTLIIVSGLSAVTLHSTSTAGLGDIPFTFSSAVSAAQQADYSWILQVSISDANALKALYPLASSSITSYLSFTNTLATDTNHNAIVAVTAAGGVAVSAFTPDTISPNVVQASLDLTAQTLVLTTDETIRISSVAPVQLTLISAPSGAQSFTLVTSSVVVISPSATQFTIALSASDLNSIKKLTFLAVSKASSNIAITASFVADMSGNAVNAITTSSPLNVATYNADTIPPTLTAFDLNMDAKLLKLTFSETVNAASLSLASLTVQSTHTSSSVSWSLSAARGSTSSSTNDPVLVVSISASDANGIKSALTLAKDRPSTWLSVSPHGVQDMAGNWLSVIVSSNAQNAALYEADVTSPVFQSFNLDMNLGLLTMTFDESVLLPSLLITDITLTSMSMGVSSFTLRAGSAAYAVADGSSLIITLDPADVNQIKLLRPLGFSAINSYLSIAAGTVTDDAKAPNAVAATIVGVTTFTPDTTSPTLSSFAFDLNTGALILNFNEVVDSATLQAGFISLKSSNAAAACLTVSGVTATSNSPNGFSVTVVLSTLQLNALKSDGVCFVSQATAYVAITSSVIKDMAGNAVVATVQQASSFTAETVHPMLSSFSFDLNLGVLAMTFTETLRVSTAQLSTITLQSVSSASMASTTDHYVLTGGTRMSTANDIYLTIQLSHTDLNALKVKRICGTAASCWLVFPTSLVQDMFGLPVIAIVNAVNAQQAAGYVPNTTPPSLVNFSLNMNTAIITLSFSESIDSTTVNVAALTIQLAADTTGLDLSQSASTLTASSTSTSSDGPIVTIQMSVSDSNIIKQRSSIAVSQASSFVSFTSSFLSDIEGNAVVAIPVTSAFMANSYTIDTSPPVILGFDLSLNAFVTEGGVMLQSAQLTLSFSETVHLASLNAAGIVIQSSHTSAATSVTLTGQQEVVSTLNSNTVVFKLVRADANAIKAIRTLAKAGSNTFLSAPSSIIKDQYGNSVAAVLASSALPVSLYTADTTAPQLLDFYINMNAGYVDLTFDETVDSTTIEPPEFALQDAVTAVNAHYQLTGGLASDANRTPYVFGSAFNDAPSVTPRFYFTKTDLDNIKALPLCKTGPDCYLTNTEYAVTDMVGNKIVHCS